MEAFVALESTFSTQHSTNHLKHKSSLSSFLLFVMNIVGLWYLVFGNMYGKLIVFSLNVWFSVKEDWIKED
jgi:hypothetical protein